MGWVAAGARRILEEAFRAGEPSVYISLHTGDPGTTGANEQPSTQAYARSELAGGGFTFPAGSTSNQYEITNTNRISFPLPTAAYPNAITHAGIWSAAAAGTFYGGFELDSSLTPQSGQALYFNPSDLGIYISTDD